MGHYLSRAELAHLREFFTKGTRVVLMHMNDPYGNLRPGDTGTVSHVDDAGTVFCRWDNGSNLGVVYREDFIEKVR